MVRNQLVSIIIPAFNAQYYISETIESIISQTYNDIEIIVIDDGSTDFTSQIVEKFCKKVKYFKQKNSGNCAIPRNTGIKMSIGEFLCFIDSDDIMADDKIENQIDFLNRHKGVDLVFSDYQNFDKYGLYSKTHFQTCSLLKAKLNGYQEIILEKPCTILSQENFGISGTFLFRRCLLEKEPGFEPSLTSCEDFHFYYRLSRHTSAGIVNKVGLFRRLHNSNMSKNFLTMRNQGIRSRLLLKENEQDIEVRKSLQAYVDRCREDLARFYGEKGRWYESIKLVMLILFANNNVRRKLKAVKVLLRTLAIGAGFYKH